MELSQMAMGMGLAGLLIYGPCLLSPAQARRGLTAFPRNRWMAWALTAVAVAWSAWLLNDAPLGRFETAKAYLPVLVPVAYGLIVYFMDELLAVRALGGLLILIPAPLLAAARWHDSSWRLVIVCLAYMMAIKGIVLVLNPYKFRKGVERFFATDGACRVCGSVGLALSAVLLVLGLTVY